ncbi:MAG: hypothetical protein CSA52_01165 [Gammaproteobacteria bacterium]|nr:MAG: hypothetical protein CSA52_01165 [Gammaproteobacteria bacterium]
MTDNSPVSLETILSSAESTSIVQPDPGNTRQMNRFIGWLYLYQPDQIQEVAGVRPLYCDIATETGYQNRNPQARVERRENFGRLSGQKWTLFHNS